ncbi:SUKH-4 family immunity protein [Streptomyces sp. NPDC051219]|uniref:SUKH-4 family immunity protein n=1 Tax=Streptomyces sp. NPDC051219 TaxID=3155283 RepID=UPI00342299C0
MLTSITAEKVIETFGLNAVTYFPRVAGAHMQESTAHFLSNVGLPEDSFFSPRIGLEDESPARLTFGPSLNAIFEADGAQCPPESEGWEVLGGFVYATVAIDPRDGRIYAFPEGEEFYVPMHADVSSLVHSLIVLEKGKSEYKKLPQLDEDQARIEVVERMKQEIMAVDETPFVSADGEWSKVFEEISFGMWG